MVMKNSFSIIVIQQNYRQSFCAFQNVPQVTNKSEPCNVSGRKSTFCRRTSHSTHRISHHRVSNCVHLNSWNLAFLECTFAHTKSQKRGQFYRGPLAPRASPTIDHLPLAAKSVLLLIVWYPRRSSGSFPVNLRSLPRGTSSGVS